MQRKLMVYFQRRGYASSIGELCQRAYGLWPRDVMDFHRRAVLRSVKLLIERGYPLATMTSRRFGYKETIVYKRDSTLSRQLAEELCKPFPREPEEESYLAPRRTW